MLRLNSVLIQQIIRKLTEALVLVLLALSVACKENYEPKERPANLPAEAVWAGGPDGGCYILCKPPENGSNACTVYFVNGQVWMKGNYVLKDNGKAVPASELKYVEADGQRIYLLGTNHTDRPMIAINQEMTPSR